jgi:exosortase
MASVFVFWTPLRALLDYSLRGGQHQYDKYSHIVLIPFIVMAMVFFGRRKIFARVQYRVRMGVILLLLGLASGVIAKRAVNQLGAENSLSLEILALVVCVIGTFILCYGTPAFRAGAFPLLFLLLAVPIPNALLDGPVSAVRNGSTEVCSMIFNLAGTPFLRNGFEFTLPNIQIEVAKECSGIHSTIALFIVSLLLGHYLLASLWRKTLLMVFVLPIVSITNGLRIAGLTLLSIYVDPRFLRGNLHRDGGIGFFLLALLFLFGVVRILRWRGSVKRPQVVVACT